MLRGISISLYMPPKGTAAWSGPAVNGISRMPLPPAMIIVSTSFIILEKTHRIGRQLIALVFDHSRFIQQYEMGYSLDPIGTGDLRIRVI